MLAGFHYRTGIGLAKKYNACSGIVFLEQAGQWQGQHYVAYAVGAADDDLPVIALSAQTCLFFDC